MGSWTALVVLGGADHRRGGWRSNLRQYFRVRKGCTTDHSREEGHRVSECEAFLVLERSILRSAIAKQVRDSAEGDRFAKVLGAIVRYFSVWIVQRRPSFST